MEEAVRLGTKALLEALASGDVPEPTSECSEANNAILLYVVHMVELYGNEPMPSNLHQFSYAVGVVMGGGLAIYGSHARRGIEPGGDE